MAKVIASFDIRIACLVGALILHCLYFLPLPQLHGSFLERVFAITLLLYALQFVVHLDKEFER